MEYVPSVMTEADTAGMIARIEGHFEEHDFGLWAVEIGVSGEFVGFTGLSTPNFEASFMPAVEVGWRFGKDHWGHGYATEAARAVLGFGFEQAGLDEIVSFTASANVRSTRVMDRIGMTHHASDDFDHPSLESDSPLRRHVLYRMTATAWAELNRR